MSAGWTFDRDDVKFDAEVPTWDGGLFGGFTQWQFADGTRILIPLSNVRTQAFQYNRRMFRAPFGTTWHQDGDAKRGVQLVNVSVEVVDDAGGIADARLLANALAFNAAGVVLIESTFGSFDVLALSSYNRVPIESGYRFNFTFGTQTGLRL